MVTEKVLAELQVQHERVTVNLSTNEQQDEKYLKEVNPNGRVPALVIDGGKLKLWEAGAITLWLGEQYGTDLYPQDPLQRGDAMKWVVWASATLAPAASQLAAQLPDDHPGSVQPGTRDYLQLHLRHEDMLARCQEQVRQSYRVLDD